MGNRVNRRRSKPGGEKAFGRHEAQRCLCGSQRPFLRCCGPYIASAPQVAAPTAEALMRSRYSAFCLGNIDYLIVTHHPSMRTADEREALTRTVQTTEWKNLVIVHKQKGQKKDKTGIVEFVAAYLPRETFQKKSLLIAQQPGSTAIEQLHERSQFVREQKQWFYLSGEILSPYQPGRSQLCWCGSHKPFKHCHGFRQTRIRQT